MDSRLVHNRGLCKEHSLWVSEGFTNYYSALFRYRMGFYSKDDFLGSIARAIAGVEQNPARQFISAADASTSTWLCYETPCAFQTSYYTQGQNLAALLDVSIRHDSGDARGLDDLMRSLYTDVYKRGRGFTPNDVVAQSSRLAGRDYRNFFRRFVTGVDVPPYDEIFEYAGYRVEKTPNRIPWLGIDFTPSDQGLVAANLALDGEAARAGVAIGDVVLKIDEATVRSVVPALNQLLRDKIGQTVKLTIRRGNEEKVMDCKVGVVELTNYRLVEMPNPTPVQLRVREGWLKR